MNNDRNRLMQSLFLPAAELIRQPNWLPAVDIYQIPGGFLVKVDLAGVRPEDFQLTIQGATLTIEGTRRDCHVEEGCCHVLLEIAYNHFERRITLPANLEGMRVTTAHDHGMLLIRMQREASRS